MFVVPIDDQLSLKLLELRDADGLFAVVDSNRGDLREWLPWVDGNTTADHSKAFIESTLKTFAANDGFQVGIMVDGKLAGAVGLHEIDWPNHQTSIGYWLAAAYQGRGIMTRACRAVVDISFSEYKLHRLEIRAGVGNRKSRGVAQRLGFREEGMIRQCEWVNDHYVDHVLYSLLAEDWER